MKIGKRIAQLQDQRGWSQDEIAEKVGDFRPSHIANIEAGLRSPSKRLLRDIARALRVDVENLKGSKV